MITEDFVSFEVAKLLKEKGFDELCIFKYNSEGIRMKAGVAIDEWQNSELDDDECSCVSLQMAMKWLREVHNILITIVPQEIGLGFDKLCYGIYRITEDLYQPLYNGKTDNLVNSYEEAVEAGIKYCLENLI